MLQMAICDDEQSDIGEIKGIISELLDEKGQQYDIDTFQSGEDLLNSSKQYQIIFLDIAMEGKNGIQTGTELWAKSKQAHIIFITNFEEYCSQAVNKVHAFAYLEKPVTKENMQSQLYDALDDIQNKSQASVQEVHFEILEAGDGSKTRLGYQKFNAAEIIYFEYTNRRVRMKLEDEEFCFGDKMMKLAERMKVYSFALCHQSYLVNLAQVKSVKGYDVYLKNGEVLPLAQKKSVEFRSKLNQYLQRSM